MDRRVRLRAALLITAGLVFAQLLVGPAPKVAAHAELLASEPSASTSTGPVRQIRLTFSQAVIPDFAWAQLSTPGRTALPLTVQIEKAVVIALVPEAVAASEGEWLLTYRIVSADGHPIDGEVRFTVRSAERSKPGQTRPPTQPSESPLPLVDAAPGRSTPAATSLAYLVIACTSFLVLLLVVISRVRSSRARH